METRTWLLSFAPYPNVEIVGLRQVARLSPVARQEFALSETFLWRRVTLQALVPLGVICFQARLGIPNPKEPDQP